MGIVCIKKNEEYYFALLNDNNNFWIFPKGHLESRETFIDATIREIYEETKIQLDYKNYICKIGEFSYFSDIENTLKLIKAYLFEIKESQIIQPNKNENFVDGKWMKFEDAIKKITYTEQKNLLIKANSIISKQIKK